MHVSAVRLIQADLKRLGHYAGAIDGARGRNTNAAVGKALAARARDLPGDWQGWSDKRKATACLQLCCRDEGIDVGSIDGLWGPQTGFACDTLEEKRRTGTMPPPWRDVRPGNANPHGFPSQSASALSAFYGPNGTPEGRRPPLRKVESPWPLKIAWDPRQTRSFIWCHEKVADSLGEVMAKVHEHYGPADIDRLGLDLFGGDYNPRRMRGGTAWSTHAWGIAIDWDPARNQLKWGRGRASLAAPDYADWWKIWEDQGWVSLGRSRDFDWMHVQAARVD